MRRAIPSLCALCALLLVFHPAAARAQSQPEMNDMAAKDFASADADLNKVYKKLVAALDSQARKNLQASQRAWIAFRDTEAELIADLNGRGGSIYPMEYAEQRTQLTKVRTKELSDLLAGQSQ